MKQVLQNLKDGRTIVIEVPSPSCKSGGLLIKTTRSLISAGTERMLVEFSKGNLIQKARSQPDKVKQVLDKIRTDGLMPTMEAVFRKLDEPMPLGYCNAGIVLEVGSDVTTFKPGDRVVSNGPHAEIVSASKNLCVKIPENVSNEHAAFTVMGSIALQGIRLAQPTLGEHFVVFGMGLIGLLTIQLLRASGCEVLAIDLNEERLALAETFGAKTVNIGTGGDPVAASMSWTNGTGADGVIITASAKNDDIMHQAAESCRKRGRIILVGVVGLDLRRSDFYKKELSFQVSCSYGPGRYDEKYEQGGNDYPIGYVRWTEQRNFEAVLGSMSSGQLNVDSLITHRFSLSNALESYNEIQNNPSALGVILQYPQDIKQNKTISFSQNSVSSATKAVIGMIGAGNFAISTLLPAVSKTPAKLAYIAGHSNPASVEHAARKFKAEKATTDTKQILNDPDVNGVFIVVGHHLHAHFVCEALKAGKHVFVEKPLAINLNELRQIEESVKKYPDRLLMVGFNRRFSPHIEKMKDLLNGRSEPLCMNMTINPGITPPDHWLHDPQVGGGRIIGEGCHFIDLMVFLTGSLVKTVSACMIGEGAMVQTDKMSILLGFEDGSVGTINYFGNGSKSYPKEMLEIFSEKRVLRLENFRRTVGYGFSRFSKYKTFRQDKGHTKEVALFIDRIINGGNQLIPFAELQNVTLATFAAMTSATEKRTLVLNEEYVK